MKKKIQIKIQATKSELIDFFIWFRNNGEAYIGLTVEELIDEYLKSINSLEKGSKILNERT